MALGLSRALWQDDSERPGCAEAAVATGPGGGGECGGSEVTGRGGV